MLDLSEIRQRIITALASDPLLFERLVLKGGNALDLVYEIGNRTSLDLDFSISGDFEDRNELRNRLFSALENAFKPARLVVVARRLEVRPPEEAMARFGGFRAEFMLVSEDDFARNADDAQALGRSALESGPGSQRRFRIEISRNEYVDAKTIRTVAQQTVYVYTLDMIVAEKLRALCQQMPEYPYRSNKTARARDFYDIYACILHGGVQLGNPDFHELILRVFASKDVPISLLGKLRETRDYHRTNWDTVVVAVAEELDEFDYYFSFVVDDLEKLKPLWEE